jgi:hypothetical protein
VNKALLSLLDDFHDLSVDHRPCAGGSHGARTREALGRP